MRIALSPPWALATGLAVVATLALRVMSPEPRVSRFHPDVVASEANAGGEAGQIQTRASLSQIERELDALTDRVTTAVDELQAAETESQGRVAAAKLARLREEIAVERRVLTARARQLQHTLAR